MLEEEFKNYKLSLDDFSEQSKVWVYFSEKNFSSIRDELAPKIKEFVSSWKSHGDNVEGSYSILSDQIVVLIANDASGCSTDSSVRFFQELGAFFQLDFFNRNLMYYLDDNKNLVTINIAEIQNLSLETLIINPYFKNLKDWKDNFIQRLGNSLYRRMR